MNNKIEKNGIFEVETLKKWAVLDNKKIEKAKESIALYTLFKENFDVLAYIAKIVFYSLFYEKGIETIEEVAPEDWATKPDCTQGASDYYSINENSIIIATSIKDSNNDRFYLIFEKNNKLNNNKAPWFFKEITTCTNHYKQKPKCISDSIKIDDLENIKTESIDFNHIFSEKVKARFPAEFQNSHDPRSLLSMIINTAKDKEKQNIKSTIRYDKKIKGIVFCYYLPLDFSNHGGNKYDLYACIRKIEGPEPRFEIPTILPYDKVYTQLLEKPKIDHWTYALCNFKEKGIRKELEDLKKKNQELNEKLTPFKADIGVQ